VCPNAIRVRSVRDQAPKTHDRRKLRLAESGAGHSARHSSGRPAPDHDTDFYTHVKHAGRQSAGADPGLHGNTQVQFCFDILLYGEDRWTSNHLLFPDSGGALDHARGMCTRWFTIEKIRIRRHGTPKN
jgi:hypothetical protein